jgi:hypothetical protein
MFFTPHSCAARPARSAATCAANGVDLREPLKPAWPEVAQDSVLPWRSVMVTMVLLNDAWMCDVLLDLLPRARGSGLLQFLARRGVSGGH